MKKITTVNGRTRVVTVNEKPTKTQQHFESQTNITNIMKRYNNNLNAVQGPVRGFYGDFSAAPQFFEAQNSILQANEAFLKLPSNIRKRFGNDPGLLLQFLDDPSNLDEAISLGLCDPKPYAPVSQPLNNDNSNDDDQAKKHKASKSKNTSPAES